MFWLGTSSVFTQTEDSRRDDNTSTGVSRANINLTVCTGRPRTNVPMKLAGPVKSSSKGMACTGNGGRSPSEYVDSHDSDQPRERHRISGEDVNIVTILGGRELVDPMRSVVRALVLYRALGRHRTVSIKAGS